MLLQPSDPPRPATPGPAADAFVDACALDLGYEGAFPSFFLTEP